MKITLFAAVLITLILTAIPEASAQEKTYSMQEAHGPEQTCRLCHTRSRLTQERAPLIKPVTALCFECHSDRLPESEHIVDIPPSMDTGILPLSDGNVSCYSCHNVHDNNKDLLRMKTDDLCLTCHQM
ncbi:cytochrome c3 family protein [bacterium]|nr:cytochrome c3 family protein [bacterium]